MHFRRFDRSLARALLVALACAIPPAGATERLEVYTWPEYIDPAIVAEFEKEFDARVDFSYFDSDEVRDKELTSSNGTGFDVIVVNGLQMTRYAERGWIAALDTALVPNAAHIEPRWRDEPREPIDGSAKTAHGVAYFWGTMGIAWREDLYPEGFSRWRDLLVPDPSLRGRILMSDFGRELVGFALMAEGHSINTTDRGLIRDAGRLLSAQREHVRGYGYPSLSADSSLLTGDVWVAPMYSGDVLQLQALDERVRYRLPEEGGQLWVDYLTIAADSSVKPLAHAFVNFLNRPAIAARNAEHVNYASPNAAAMKHVSAQYLANPVIHPGEDELRGSEFLRPLPARSTKSVNTVMTELRIGG